MYWYGTHLEPLVDALCVELVAAGEDPEGLAHLEVAHAHHAHSLVVVLAAVTRVPAKKRLQVRYQGLV